MILNEEPPNILYNLHTSTHNIEHECTTIKNLKSQNANIMSNVTTQ